MALTYSSGFPRPQKRVCTFLNLNFIATPCLDLRVSSGCYEPLIRNQWSVSLASTAFHAAQAK